MKPIEDIILPKDVKYTDEHIWVKPDGDVLICGVSDYAQDQLGEVAYVDLPEAGAQFAAGDAFGSIESVKAVNSLYMPVAGEIVEVNSSLETAPEKVNQNCYANGWIVKIKPDADGDQPPLLDADAYRQKLSQA